MCYLRLSYIIKYFVISNVAKKGKKEYKIIHLDLISARKFSQLVLLSHSLAKFPCFLHSFSELMTSFKSKGLYE